MTELREALRRVPLFKDATPHELDALIRGAEAREHRRDEVIIEAQRPADGLYVIGSGRVKVLLPVGPDREVILATLGPGDHFGEMAFLDAKPRSATVVAQLATRTFRISRDHFTELLGTYPPLARRLLFELSTRLRNTNSQVESLVTLDVIGRLARYVIGLARDHGRDLGNGWIAVRRPSYKEVAAAIGAARETVSRLMARLERRGLVVNEGVMTYLPECVLRHGE
jgi:CRP/FNR family transcriptional regulator, cyclic AMP receptor protein